MVHAALGHVPPALPQAESRRPHPNTRRDHQISGTRPAQTQTPTRTDLTPTFLALPSQATTTAASSFHPGYVPLLLNANKNSTLVYLL